MYICLNGSIDSDMDEYFDQASVSVEFCESIFNIFHLNHYNFCTLVTYIIILVFKLTNFAEYSRQHFVHSFYTNRIFLGFTESTTHYGAFFTFLIHHPLRK